MFVMEYEREFLSLSRYAKNMFQTEKEMCDKFESELRDEIRALMEASECMTLATMATKVHKMEPIVKDKSKNFEKEKMKRGRSSPHIHRVLKSIKITLLSLEKRFTNLKFQA